MLPSITTASLTRSARAFMSDTRGATAIEYAILASCVAVAVVTVIITTGATLTGTYQRVHDAYPS